MQLTLIGRRYCHLCDEMRVAVEAARQDFGFSGATKLVEIDLDEYPALEDRYAEWVPVLLAGSVEAGVEICHYHFDAEKWRAAVESAIARSAEVGS